MIKASVAPSKFHNMSDSLYPPGQINHLGSNGVDSHSARFYHEAHTPHSAVRCRTQSDFLLSSFIPHTDYMLGIPYSRYDQVSSFNYPVRYDANLNTPVSIYGDSPVRQRETEAYGTSSRNSMNPELSFISNHGLSFIGGHSNSSAEMKAKTGHNRGPTPSIAGDTRQSWDAFLNDSPLTLAPPTHHFGSFSVSSPLESSMTSTPRSGVSMPTFTQAPILTQPNPQSIREKHGKRSYDDYDRTPLMNPQCQFMPQSSQNYLASSEMDRASGKSHQEHESLHIIPVPGYVKSEATPPPTVVIPSLHTPSVRQQSVASTTLSTDTSRKRRRTTNSPPMSQHSSKSYLHAYNQGVAFSTRPQETDVLTAMTEADLTVDERLLKELRDGGSRVRTWKETLLLFNAQAKKTASHEATLQMRYTRLNEKLRAWKEHEVSMQKPTKSQETIY